RQGLDHAVVDLAHLEAREVLVPAAVEATQLGHRAAVVVEAPQLDELDALDADLRGLVLVLVGAPGLVVDQSSALGVGAGGVHGEVLRSSGRPPYGRGIAPAISPIGPGALRAGPAFHPPPNPRGDPAAGRVLRAMPRDQRHRRLA